MNFDTIYSLSTENHGIVTYSAALALGVKGKDLARWVKIGRMLKLGHGVYRTTQYPFSEDDQFANAVALAGPRAYLCGESVLAYLRLSSSVDVRTILSLFLRGVAAACLNRLKWKYVHRAINQ